MRPRRVIAPVEATTMFDQAVRENAIAVVSVQDGDDWSTMKSRFLERDGGRRFFVLDYAAQAAEVLPSLTPGQYVGVSFRHRSRKIMFSTVVEAKGRYALEGRDPLPAIRYRWPQSITELQRRAYYRTRAPSGVTLPVSMWEGGVSHRVSAQSAPLSIVSGAVIDISCGGCLIGCGMASAPTWAEGATLGAELTLNDGRAPIVVNANYRGARHDETGQLCIALQFVGLEFNADGRAALQRLTTAVQKLHRLTSVSNTSERGSEPPSF